MERAINEVYTKRPEEKNLDLRVLVYLVSYAEHQIGDRIPGKAYRERENDQRIDNWSVELKLLIPLCIEVIKVFTMDESYSMIDRDNFLFPCHEKMLDILRPWSEHLDMDSVNQTDRLNKEQINLLFQNLFGK
jgi:hypothetical protein